MVWDPHLFAMQSINILKFDHVNKNLVNSGIKRIGSIKSRKVSSQSLQSSGQGGYGDDEGGGEDTESLLSDEATECPSTTAEHQEPDDFSLCQNMPWIKVSTQALVSRFFYDLYNNEFSKLSTTKSFDLKITILLSQFAHLSITWLPFK